MSDYAWIFSYASHWTVSRNSHHRWHCIHCLIQSSDAVLSWLFTLIQYDYHNHHIEELLQNKTIIDISQHQWDRHKSQCISVQAKWDWSHCSNRANQDLRWSQDICQEHHHSHRIYCISSVTEEKLSLKLESLKCWSIHDWFFSRQRSFCHHFMYDENQETWLHVSI